MNCNCTIKDHENSTLFSADPEMRTLVFLDDGVAKTVIGNTQMREWDIIMIVCVLSVMALLGVIQKNNRPRLRIGTGGRLFMVFDCT